jgi:hypothetical protein
VTARLGAEWLYAWRYPRIVAGSLRRDLPRARTEQVNRKELLPVLSRVATAMDAPLAVAADRPARQHDEPDHRDQLVKARRWAAALTSSAKCLGVSKRVDAGLWSARCLC